MTWNVSSRHETRSWQMRRLLLLKSLQRPSMENVRRRFAFGQVVAIALLTTIFAGCAPQAPTRPPLARDLPPPPAFSGRVLVKAPKSGEPLLVIAARYKGGLKTANSKIDAWDKWYAQLRKSYAAPVEGNDAKY